MGKNLKGKECGKGIYQRKDGLYSARYYSKNGKRKERYFETLPEHDLAFIGEGEILALFILKKQERVFWIFRDI